MPRLSLDLPTAAFLICLLLLDRSAMSLISFAAAACHEAGHILAMLLLDCEVREIRLTLVGAELRCPASRCKGLVVAVILAAGGAANLICVPIALSLDCEAADFFALCSMMLAILNFLPIRTLDGGELLSFALNAATPRHAETIISVVSALTLGLLWLTAGYILLLSGGNLSLYLFCVYMFATLYFNSEA